MLNSKKILKEQRSSDWIKLTDAQYDTFKSKPDKYEVDIDGNDVKWGRRKTSSPTPQPPNPNPNPNPRPPKPKPKPNTTPTPATPEDTKIEEVSLTVSDICIGGKILKKGMKGGIVKLLQTKLSITDTGVFDDKTVTGVESHQKQKDLIPSGQVDKETWESIFAGTKHACTKKIDKIKDPEVDYSEKTWKGESIIKRALMEQGREIETEPLTTQDASPNKQVDDSKTLLEKAINVGCIANISKQYNFVVDDEFDQPVSIKGSYAIGGTIDGKRARILPNYTVIKSEDGKTFTKIANWKCPSLEAPESSRSCPNSKYLNYQQNQFVTAFLKQHLEFKCAFPPIEEIAQGEWAKADLCKVSEGLFPNCGQFFFFTRVKKTGKTIDEFSAIDEYLTKIGWTFDKPDFGKNVPTSTVGKYISKQDLGNVDPNTPIYRTEIPNPSDAEMLSAAELSKSITEKNQRPDKATCKNAIELLYNAGFQNQGYQYFQKRGDLAVVREYAYRCYTTKTINTNKNKTLGGVGYKLYRLASEAYGQSGVRKFFLGGYGESTFTNENILSKTINKKLLEMKKMKDNAKDSETLLENKLKTMVSRIKNNLSGKL